MKWLKERSALAMLGAVLAIIICTLCVIFAGTIPAIVITILSISTMSIIQEVQVYLSNTTYEFDWLNVGAIALGEIWTYSHKMTKGDIVSVLLIFRGGEYYASLINHNN